MVEEAVVDDSDGGSVGRVWHLDWLGAGISDCAFHLHSVLSWHHGALFFNYVWHRWLDGRF